jgi:hypothetical protein
MSWINAQGSASAQYRSGFFKTSTAIALKDAEVCVLPPYWLTLPGGSTRAAFRAQN